MRVFLLCLTFLVGLLSYAQPANDNCANATNLVVNAPYQCTTTALATTQAGEQCASYAGQTNRTIWYRFTATSTTMVLNLIKRNVTNGPGVLSVYGPNATCVPSAASQILACTILNGDPGTYQSLTGLLVGGVYLIQYNGSDAGGPDNRTHDICIGIFTEASNNSVSTGSVIDACGTTFNGTTMGGYFPSGNGLGFRNLDNNLATVCPACPLGYGADVPFVINNDSWFSFCAASAGTWQVSFTVGACTLSGLNSGLQMAIFTGTPGALTWLSQAPSPTYTGITWVSPNITLAAGECAYLMVDGFAGDACGYSYVLSPVGASPCDLVTTCSITANTLCTLPGQYTLSGEVTFANPPATGTMTVVNSCGGSQVFNAPFTSPIAYSIPGLTANGASCTVSASFSDSTDCSASLPYTAPLTPAAPTASVTVQPTCTTPTGTIVVTAPTGATIQYSVGGAYQSSGTFTGLTPGSYNVTAQDTATGCISAATVLVVNPIPANPAAPTASVTVQPTCVVLGTIVVTAPTGATIQYSVGGAYQSSGTFTGLTPGSYNVTAQNTATGCISAATVLVVNPIPANPAAPTTSVTVQPTCTTPTGTIVVTAPTGATIQYSVGGAYQSSGTFTGLTPGSYNVTAQDTATGCISAATVLVVNPIPANPAAPTASVTVQPTCVVLGTIVVTAPTGATIQYSVGGAYQVSGTFTGLTPGSYNVTAQDTATGCISGATVLVVNAIPANPAAPTASVTVQPTCTTPTGTIVVTAPTGATIQYSVGGAYQASGTFTGLTPGSYNVTAQDTATGCISAATVLVVNAIPANPAAPTASVTVQPTCVVLGTIVVTSPTGATTMSLS